MNLFTIVGLDVRVKASVALTDKDGQLLAQAIEARIKSVTEQIVKDLAAASGKELEVVFL